MGIDYAIVGICVGTGTALVWALIVTMILDRHNSMHKDTLTCFEHVDSILKKQLEARLDQSADIATLFHDLASLPASRPSLSECHICGRVDFTVNMEKLTGDKLNKIGLVPLKGDLKFDAGRLFTMHTECAGIRKCANAVGWEKTPTSKGSK